MKRRTLLASAVAPALPTAAAAEQRLPPSPELSPAAADYSPRPEQPDPALPWARDTDLQPSDHELALVLRQLEAHRLESQGRWSPRQQEAAHARLVRWLASWVSTVNRRHILQLLGGAATVAVGSPWSQLDTDDQERMARAVLRPGRVDGHVVDQIQAVLWSSMRQDDALGPLAALDTVLAQRTLARTLLPECPDAVRPRLLSVYAALSRYAGWLTFDLEDFDAASYYYEQARLAAHEARNTELGAHILCNMSQLATWQGQHRVGIDHALAAQGWAGRIEDFGLLAFAADVSAKAYALDALDGQASRPRQKRSTWPTSRRRPATSSPDLSRSSTRKRCVGRRLRSSSGVRRAGRERSAVNPQPWPGPPPGHAVVGADRAQGDRRERRGRPPGVHRRPRHGVVADPRPPRNRCGPTHSILG